MARSSMTQTLKYAMDVPRAVTGDTPTWGVNELGRSLALHKSTVSGLLATME
jgi:DNA-binding IclR family transcriptional regulator